MYAISGGLQLIIAAVLMHPWDTFVFQRSVEDFLLRGLTPYQVAEMAPAYTYWGGVLPARPLWYAYPPLPLLMMVATSFPSAFGWADAEWMGRLLVRLPFIAGTLGFAWTARKLIVTAEGQTSADAARRGLQAERWILLNPLFIIIAALWGQFEAVLLLLLALGLLAMRRSQWAVSGALWGLAVCIKLFPLYLAPLYAVHLARRAGRGGVLRFAAGAAAVGAAVNLPFFLASPHGFLQQVLFMHGERPPARLAPLAYLTKLLEVMSRGSTHMPAPTVWDQWLGPVSFILTTVVVIALALASRRQAADEARLIEWSAWTLLGGLLATKVLNEQYLVLPFGMLVLAHLHPQRTPGKGHRFVIWSGSWAVTIAALFAGFTVLYSMPAGLANALLGGPAPEAIGRIAASIGLAPTELRSTLNWVTGLLLLVPAVVAVRHLWPALGAGMSELGRRLPAGFRHEGGAVRPVAFGVGLALLCATPLAVALIGGGQGPTSAMVGGDDRWVLAEYTTSWYNPVPDGSQPAGSWTGDEERPAAGYYNINAHKVQTDLANMRRAGIDGVVVQVHPFYTNPAALSLRVAQQEGMPSAFGLDLGTLDPDGLAFAEDDARAVRSLIESPLPGHWTTTHALQGPDGGRLMFVSGIGHVAARFTAAEHEFALQSLLGIPGPDDGAIALARQSPPRSHADLQADSAVAATWRAAYDVAGPRWWSLAFDVDGVDLVTDRPVPYAANVVGTRAAAEPAAFEATAALRFTTLDLLTPASVRPAFMHAFWTEAPGVLVPWNDFRHDRAAEPTQRDGDATLGELTTWIRHFHVGDWADDDVADDETPQGGPWPPLPWPPRRPIDPRDEGFATSPGSQS